MSRRPIRTRWTLFAASVIALASLAGASRGEDGRAILLPNDSKFVLHLDLEALQETEIAKDSGGKIKQKVFDNLVPDGDDDIPNLEKLIEMLGFDPFSEVRSITISASDYEAPEENLLVIVSMGKTTGNLEGLLLAVPGYEVNDYGSHRIHSVSPDDDGRAFVSIHTSKDGSKELVLGTNEAVVKSTLDQLDGKPAPRGKRLDSAAAAGTFLDLQVFDIPVEELGEGLQSNVAKMVEDLRVRISEDSDKLKLSLTMSTASEAQAEQLQQMFQGLIAFVGFCQSAEPDDKDLQTIQKFTQALRASRNGAKFEVDASFDAEELAKLLESAIEED